MTREPFAYGIQAPIGSVTPLFHKLKDAEDYIAKLTYSRDEAKIIPLYRSPLYALSGNAENVDWTDIAETGRAHADNLVGEPGITKLMHLMAYEIDRLRLTDAEREDLQMWLAECLRQCSTATEGANEELAERWQGRAKRAAAMIERLGGGR